MRPSVLLFTRTKSRQIHGGVSIAALHCEAARAVTRLAAKCHAFQTGVRRDGSFLELEMSLRKRRRD